MPNNTLPTGVGVGRVTVALGSGHPGDESYVYILIGNPPPPAVPGFFNDGTGEADTNPPGAPDGGSASKLPSGLYRSKDNGLNFTKVMLRELLFHPTTPPTEHPHDINLLGVEASDTGALEVDLADRNVVYVGGSRRFQANDPYSAHGASLTHGLIRVDTGNMRDSTYVAPNGAVPNDGDDITKALVGTFTKTEKADKGKYVSGADYIGEGVFWYDLEQDQSGENGGKRDVPRAVTDFTFANGKLLAATSEGLFRLTPASFGYDATSGGFGITVTKISGSPYTKPTLAWTDLNGNLAIADLTSVALDPIDRSRFYTSEAGTGTTVLQGLGTATVAGGTLTGPVVNFFGNLDIPTGATIRVGAPDPLDPNSPRNVYRNWFYANGRAALVERSPNGGLTFLTPENKGLSVAQPADFLPPLAVGTERVAGIDPMTGLTRTYDQLLFGTDRVYLSRTSANEWSVVGADRPLSARGGLVSALAFAPPLVERVAGIYAGTTAGEVFVNLGNDPNNPFFQDRSAGLPRSPILGITVDPNNPSVAYVTLADTVRDGSAGEVWYTADAGQHWTNISSNLPPDIAAYSLALDPRTFATTPRGRLYVGTDVGVYTSVNNGTSWQSLGVGLPHAPTVDLQLDTRTDTLAAATQGRGLFALSTDIIGARAVGTTPTTPVGPGASTPAAATPIASVTVTFNEALDPTSFTVADVRVTGPGGRSVRVTSVAPTDAGNTTFQINFDPQGTSGADDGTYTVVVGPAINDAFGNPLDQNGNGINGEASDAFTFTFVINGTDDGRFLSGLFHDLLGRAADIPGFASLLAGIDDARFAQLPAIASGLVGSDAARTALITSLYQSSRTPASLLGVGDLLGVAPTADEVNRWLNLLRSGAKPEALLQELLADDRYFTQNRPGVRAINGDVTAYVKQVTQDVLGRAPSDEELQRFLTIVNAAGVAARRQIGGYFITTVDYFQDVVRRDYQNVLGRAPSQAEVDGAVGRFRSAAALTQEQFLAELYGSQEFFDRAPALVGASGSGTNETYVRALYAQLFPGDTVQPAELTAGLNQLSGGTSRRDYALQLLSTDRYRVHPGYGLVDRLYQRFLGRAAAPAELAYWKGRFDGGLRDEFLVAELLSSEDFVARNKGSATSAHDIDVSWVNAAYTQAFGRLSGPSPEELQANLDFLARGERTGRNGFAGFLLGAPEFFDRETTQVYQQFLGRAPAAAELAYWRTVLARSGAAGQLSPSEGLIAALLGSRDYFVRQTDGQGLHTNQSWINSLFSSLRIPADATAANAALNAILNGFRPQRLAEVNGILAGVEYRTRFTRDSYQTYLGRQPSQPEVDFWLGQFRAGLTQEGLIASLVGSSAYFDRSASIVGATGPSTTTTFIQAAYLQLFGVAATSSEVTYWIGRLATISRQQLAAELLVTDRYRFDPVGGLVTRLYRQYLGRDANAAELAFWQTQYRNGLRTEGLVADLVSSNAYFVLGHTFP